MVDDADRSHDTDPLADTQAPSADTSLSMAPTASGSMGKRRSVQTGDTLGRYELGEDVGEGGMATVYRARDKELRRDVAVKVLFPHLARREDIVRRFHREARAAAGLEHANILRVYDVGGAVETNDPPYIVMELIRGHSLLGEIEQRGPMLSEVAACIGALLADALAVAHKAGIIHRDIKPANVMVAPGGRILLADFGVARLETEDSLVTKTGALLGTPAYMSPEQASGDTATAKSDLYSLGATLYQLATGHLPYTGSPAKVLAQIASGAYVSAVRKRTEVGPDLSRVIDRCMAVEADQRPASAAEVATELRAIAAASGFAEPVEELAQYFADSAAFTAQKRPGIVAAMVKAGQQAIHDGKLPRAIALADRASALAPDDPAVTALVATVTEGGRSSQRRRVLAIAGIGVLVAGGATFGAMQLLGDGPSRVLDAGVAVAPADAAITQGDAAVIATVVDAGADRAITEFDAGVVAIRRSDAGISDRRRDAAIATVPRDAGLVAPPDAGTVASVRPDAAVVAAPGFIIVKSDAWCDVTIDGVTRGRISATPIQVDAGSHTVTCEQMALGKKWSKQVTVAAGATVEAKGSLMGTHIVSIAVDAVINGKAYTAGQSLPLASGRYQVEVGGTREWVNITRPCQIRSSPQISCY